MKSDVIILMLRALLTRAKVSILFLKDKRIAKLELCEVNLSEEDAARISQRFGIA